MTDLFIALMVVYALGFITGAEVTKWLERRKSRKAAMDAYRMQGGAGGVA